MITRRASQAMKRKVKTATETIQIDTNIGGTIHRITILNGEIVRIVINSSALGILYHIEENSDLEFDDSSDERISDWNKHYGNITHEWWEKGKKIAVYSMAEIFRDPLPQFDELCQREIENVAEHNLKELRKLYKELKGGPMKALCREYQREMLKLLDF